MSKKKKIWISVIALILVAAAVATAVVVPRLPKEEVLVYSFDMMGYINTYTGGSESYGMVTTDRVQSAYISATQSVQEILVYQGQTVKKGDVLYRYDTTLSDLEVEKKELSIKQMELNLSNAQAELKALNSMKAMVIPSESSTNSNKNNGTEAGKSPKDEDIQPGEIYEGSGTSYKPYRVWLKKYGEGSYVSEDMIYEYLQAKNIKMTSKVYVVFGVVNSRDKEYESQYGICYSMIEQKITSDNSDTMVEAPDVNDPETEDENTGEDEGGTGQEPSDPTDPSQPTDASDPTDASLPTEATEPGGDATEPTETQPSETEPVQTKTIIQMNFFDPSDSAQEDDSEIVWNSGYTASELKSMREEKNAEIAELKFEIKMAEAELKIMEKEADNGEVVADFDGTVLSVLEPANALATNSPMIKVAGGGGFYVEGSVSELDLATIQVGQTVTVTSWDTYQTYQGTVTEIGAYPTEDENYFYGGSSNLSYYPYKVFIDETADLQEGYYVSMIYQSEPTQDGGTMYLENAFLREENGEHYVYVRGEDGLLEKRVVQVGDSSDGYMTIIESGLSEMDYIAFPYGKDVKEGAPAIEGTWEDLYGY